MCSKHGVRTSVTNAAVATVWYKRNYLFHARTARKESRLGLWHKKGTPASLGLPLPDLLSWRRKSWLSTQTCASQNAATCLGMAAGIGAWTIWPFAWQSGEQQRGTRAQALVQMQAKPGPYDGWAHCEQYKDELIETVTALTSPTAAAACAWSLSALRRQNQTDRSGGSFCLARRAILWKLCTRKRQMESSSSSWPRRTRSYLVSRLTPASSFSWVARVEGSGAEGRMTGRSGLRTTTKQVPGSQSGARQCASGTTQGLPSWRPAHGLARYANICQSSNWFRSLSRDLAGLRAQGRGVQGDLRRKLE